MALWWICSVIQQVFVLGLGEGEGWAHGHGAHPGREWTSDTGAMKEH